MNTSLDSSMISSSIGEGGSPTKGGGTSPSKYVKYKKLPTNISHIEIE